MWKIENWGLGVVALVLWSTVVAGQEKPVKERELRQLLRQFQVEVAGMRRAQNAQVNFVRRQRPVYPVEPSTMTRVLRPVVGELQGSVAIVRGSDGSVARTSLDTMTKATMQARRVIRELQDASVAEQFDAREDAEDSRYRTITAVSRDGTRIIIRRQVRRAIVGGDVEAGTPLEEAEASLAQAIAVLRYAANVAEANQALDEVDHSVMKLRQLLWEKKTGKRD